MECQYNRKPHCTRHHSTIAASSNMEEVNQESDQRNPANEDERQKIFIEHRNFLELYKQKRKLNQLRIHNEASMENDHEIEEHSSFNKLAVSLRMSQIHERLMQQIQSQSNSSPEFKVYTQIMQTKKDLKRIEKERFFVSSQRSKILQYREPKLSLFSIRRLNTEEVYGSNILCKRAKSFAHKMQQEQQSFLGKQVLRKKNEEEKLKRLQLRTIVQKQEERSLERDKRKSKAIQNLSFIKQRSKISSIFKQKYKEQKIGELIEHNHNYLSSKMNIPFKRVSEERQIAEPKELSNLQKINVSLKRKSRLILKKQEKLMTVGASQRDEEQGNQEDSLGSQQPSFKSYQTLKNEKVKTEYSPEKEDINYESTQHLNLFTNKPNIEIRKIPISSLN